MKKSSVVSLVLLLVSMVTYATEWKSGTNKLYAYPYSTTKVGIGVTSPQSKLHVQCSAYGPIPDEQQSVIYGYNTGSSFNPIGVYGKVNSSGGKAICGYAGSGGYGGYFRGRGYFSENVGIGTTSPQEKLHVNGSIRGNQNGALRINTGYGYVDIGPRTSSWAHFRTDRARYHFDKEIRVNSGYIGSYDENLKLRTSGTTRMTILNSNGNVGIGTNQPSQLLDLCNNNIHQIEFDRTANSAIFNLFYIGPSTGGDVDHLGIHTNGSAGDNMVVFKSNGRVGIGTTTPFGPLSVKTYDNHNLVVENFTTGVRIAVSQDDSTSNEELVLSGGLGENHVTIHRSGNVGIGTTDPGSYKLAVNGHIRTKEITVESDWADFVFEDDYQLMPLEKLEKHIKKEKNLPGIPKEKEVKENGVEVGEMQAKLLEKVEELTLYVIELKKENTELKKRINALEN